MSFTTLNSISCTKKINFKDQPFNKQHKEELKKLLIGNTENFKIFTNKTYEICKKKIYEIIAKNLNKKYNVKTFTSSYLMQNIQKPVKENINVLIYTINNQINEKLIFKWYVGFVCFPNWDKEKLIQNDKLKDLFESDISTINHKLNEFSHKQILEFIKLVKGNKNSLDWLFDHQLLSNLSDCLFKYILKQEVIKWSK